MVGVLGVQVVEQHERYLGLPTFVGKNKKQTFSYIKERVLNKLCGRKGKCLSNAGRELLIKVVTQALSADAMYCFLLPRTFCDDLHKLMAWFSWGNDPKARKIHWWFWEKLCKPKDEGGILKAHGVLVCGSIWFVGNGASIKELIDTKSFLWKLVELHALFLEEEHYNSRGEYIVNSGYLVARELVQSNSASAPMSEGSNAFSPLWKSICRAKIPPKCGACSGNLETDGHVFWECVFEKALWLGSPLGASILSEPGTLMCEWLISVVENQRAKFDLVCMVLWGLWQTRNSLMPPCDRWVKINVDGATRLKHFSGGEGAVLRDWTGRFLVAGAWRNEGIGSTFHAEFEAVLEGFRLAGMLQVRRVIVESDSALAIAAVNNYSRDLFEFGLLAEDVRQVEEFLSPVHFVHVPRTCNGVAHRLAKFAFLLAMNLYG
ncbi:hypothetical protein ACFX16_030091 [Malus domestica]